MARNIDDIQRDIERARRNLAYTLDEIVDRSKPTNIFEDVKALLTTKLQDPEVQKVVAGIGAAVAGLVLVSMVRSSKRRKELKELRRMLVARDS